MDTPRVRSKDSIPGFVQDLASLVSVSKSNSTNGDLKGNGNEEREAMNPEDPSLLIHNSIVAQEGDQGDGCTENQDQVWKHCRRYKDRAWGKEDKGAHAEEDHPHELAIYQRQKDGTKSSEFVHL